MRSGRIIADRYRLEQPLASGGMGTVWVAEHTQLGTQVAVKFMDPDLTSDPDLRSRFEREAKSAAALQSPHVIHILDYGMEGDTPFIAMELLRGEDLEMRLARSGGRLLLPEALKVVMHTCKALRAAHDAGIVHRDLKPSNLFLTKDGDDELVKVLDFGIAKETGFAALGISSKHHTSARELLGSPAYISPEQIRRARAVDHRTDLWSLAVIAYEICTGALPFDSEDAGDILAQILTEDAAPATMINGDLPPALDTFFSQALERDVDARYQSARELARAFVGACSGLLDVDPDISGVVRPGPTSLVPSSNPERYLQRATDRSVPPTPSSAPDLDDAVIQVEKVQASTLVLEDPDRASPLPRLAPAEAFRTDAPRSVDITSHNASRGSSATRWLGAAAVAAIAGLGFVLSSRGTTRSDARPAAEPTSPGSVATSAAPGPSSAPTMSASAIPSAAPAASASSPKTVQPAPQRPRVAGDRTPSPASPQPAAKPAAKPKSNVLGF